MQTNDAVDLSIVIPVFNEAENIYPLHEQLSEVLENMGRSYEIIFVDDGSEDGSTEKIEELAKADMRIVHIQFRRNFGQTAALAAGFDHAKGEIIITMDADLQNDPKDIPLLLKKMGEKYDVVSGWRKDRKDPYWSRRLPSILANKLISGIMRVPLHDYGCTLKAYRREVIKSIRLYGDLHRFIPVVSNWMGVNMAEVEVTHHPRRHGATKYGIYRTITVFLDLINLKFLLSFSTRPIQIFGGMGLLSLFLGLITTLVVIGLKISTGFDITGNPLFLGAILFFLVGIQFLMLGLLGEIVIRIYHESQDRKIYVVRQVIRNGEVDQEASS